MKLSPYITLGVSDIELLYLQALIESINEAADMELKRESVGGKIYTYKEIV